VKLVDSTFLEARAATAVEGLGIHTATFSNGNAVDPHWTLWIGVKERTFCFNTRRNITSIIWIAHILPIFPR
jgi:hypothetical protein